MPGRRSRPKRRGPERPARRAEDLAMRHRLLQFDLFDAPESAPGASPRAPRRFVHGGTSFHYELLRASRRSVGIRIDDSGVRVSAPRWVSIGQVEQVLADKADWVLQQLRAREQRLAEQHRTRIDWCEGGRLPYLGGSLTLRLEQAVHAPTLSGDAGELLLPLAADSAVQLLRDQTEAWMREQARDLFQQRARVFAERLDVRVQAVGLSSARTRWGSASADGRIRLHWRLLHFAPSIIDYVIAHEVAHLREMNHSARFWSAVGEAFPGWREARGALRKSVLPPW